MEMMEDTKDVGSAMDADGIYGFSPESATA
jgi:hypothetical protein